MHIFILMMPILLLSVGFDMAPLPPTTGNYLLIPEVLQRIRVLKQKDKVLWPDNDFNENNTEMSFGEYFIEFKYFQAVLS